MKERLGILLAAVIGVWMLRADTSGALRVRVQDVSGAAVAGAVVEARTTGGILLERLVTAVNGEAAFSLELPAVIQLRVTGREFAQREVVLSPGEVSLPAVIVLEPASVYTRITVNGLRGGAEEATVAPQVAVIADRRDVEKRPQATVGQALEHQPGILVQQSTYAQVSPTLRGVTGYHVLNLIDGIRFNNSIFRSGPNQYLALVDAQLPQRMEATLGPGSTQYGSDSLGGTVHIKTEETRFTGPGEWETHGEVGLSGASADFSGQSAARVGMSREHLFLLAGAAGRRHNDLRAGRGFDSRNVFHRLFGLTPGQVRQLMGGRQRGTGFDQWGLEGKLAWRMQPDRFLTFHYLRGEQEGVQGYKDLLGGLGRVQSTFEPQRLNWFYGRWEQVRWGWLDTVSATFSVNSQTDGGVRQNLKITDPITRDRSRVRAYGYSAQGTTHAGAKLFASFGGDVYDERIASEREVLRPLSGEVTRPRALYPNASSYQSLAVFSQASYELSPAWRAAGGVRFTAVRFHAPEDAARGVTESRLWFRDTTFHSSLRWQTWESFGLHGVVSRGFRAPNLNDLGALGLNDLGYEIPAAAALAAGALLATDAGEAATAKGEPLRALTAESLMNYELGARVTTGGLHARLQLFDAEFAHPIVRRTLLFPALQAPSQLAGIPVTPLPPTAAQRAQGVVAVATPLDPRAVKAFVNDGRSRYYGLETIVRALLTSRWTWESNYSFLVGRELNPSRNIRRLPPQMGATTLRYLPGGRRVWVEVTFAAAGRQSRLSGGDRDDERIGGSRRRRDIQDFFEGAVVAPYRRGAVFVPTGETLAQIQNRVLPAGAVINGVLVEDNNTRVPLYTATAGWATWSVRSGIPLGERWQLLAAGENLADRNYRVHGSGIDAPGRNLYLRLSFRF